MCKVSEERWGVERNEQCTEWKEMQRDETEIEAEADPAVELGFLAEDHWVGLKSYTPGSDSILFACSVWRTDGRGERWKKRKTSVRRLTE